MKSIRHKNFDQYLKSNFSKKEIEEIKNAVSKRAFAHALTSMRIKSGISQKEMAEALKCSQPPRISAIENSTNEKINMQTILKYCEVTRQAFKATLPDGRMVSVSAPQKVAA